MLVGSSLPQLVEMYGKPTETVVLMGSAYALGRVTTAYIMGRMVEKFGPIKVLLCGIILVSAYFVGVPTIHVFFVGLISAFLGGAGMATQDTVCPVLLSTAFKENYAGSLSAGQALFGLGNFATPFIIGVLLSAGTGFLLCLWDFIFYYLIWGYGSSAISFGKLMLILIYTVALSGPIYLLARIIALRLNPVLRA